MKLIRNAVGISHLILILLLVIVFTVGAVLSYMWTMGYYISLGLRLPEAPTLTITNATFNPQNPTFFNLTLLNPSLSSSNAIVTDITVSTEDGVLDDVGATLPVKLSIGESKTLRCSWNWANHTGENVKIHVFIADGSGAAYETKTPLVDLAITQVVFDSTISITHFNITVQNSLSSVTYVDIANVKVNTETVQNVTPSVPYTLHPKNSVSFMCLWDWTDYQGKDIRITVDTLQGYVAYYPEPPEHTTLPSPVVLTITDVLFEVTNTTRFNVKVQYSEGFPQYVNITRITATLENGTLENITKPAPPLPYTLNRSSSETFLCPWNWTEHRDETVTITVYTLQGFVAPPYTKVTPAPIILKVTDPIFDPINTTSFNVTVENSEFSRRDANITEIFVTIKNETVTNITDVVPFTLNWNESVTVTCSWDWADYSGENVTIVVQTQEGYSSYSSPITLAALTITDVLFNPLDTNHFLVTIQNPTELNFNITTINATIKDGPVLNITDVEPDLSFILPPSTNLTFMCSCGWAGYQGEVTITIETSEGYTTSRTFKIPSV